MRNYNQNYIKKAYSTPDIEIITLDKEIALLLESIPPLPPEGIRKYADDEYLNNDPYQPE